MQVALDNFDQHRSHDTETLKREIDSLRRQLKDNPSKGKPLSWDTELLYRKTVNLSDDNIVSCTNPDWKLIVERIDIGPEGIRIDDIRTVEHIEFVAAFAAKNQLTITYGNRSFHLEPRHLN